MQLKYFFLLIIILVTPCYSDDINSKTCFDELYLDRTKTLDELYKKQIQRVQQQEPFEDLVIEHRRYIEKMCGQYVYCEDLESTERNSVLSPFMKSTIFESCIIGEQSK